MEIQEIEITIDKKGQVHIFVKGVNGEFCLELTRDLEEILGNEIIQRDLTPEYHNKPGNVIRSHIQNKTR